MAQKPLSILISGAGVAGASLALILARHPSFKVKPIITLIERSATPRSTGQAIDIRGQGVDVIRQLGLEPTIKARHTTEKGFAFVDTHGGIVARFDATGDAKQQSITSEYEILRSELVDLLLADLDKAKAAGANVNVIHGESIASIDDTDAGVTVTFKNNILPQQTFDAVLGADGSSSKTRKLMFGDTDYRKPSGMYIAFFTIPRIESDDEIYRLCMLPGGLSLHLRPHRGGKTMGAYLAISNGKKAPIPELDEVLAQDLASQKKYLQERFRGAGWQADRFVAALDAADDFYMTHWCQVVTPKWTKGRVAILGDAAFATMGIGTSMAFMSAYVVAGELSKVASSSEVPAALERYEAVFRPFAKKTERSLPGGSLMAPQSAFGIGVLQTVVKVVAMTRVHKLALAMFGGEEKDGWKLPEYGFEGEKVVVEK